MKKNVHLGVFEFDRGIAVIFDPDLHFPLEQYQVLVLKVEARIELAGHEGIFRSSPGFVVQNQSGVGIACQMPIDIA